MLEVTEHNKPCGPERCFTASIEMGEGNLVSSDPFEDKTHNKVEYDMKCIWVMM